MTAESRWTHQMKQVDMSYNAGTLHSIFLNSRTIEIAVWTQCIWYFYFHRNDVIPIAMGAPRSDYEKVAPRQSFIHVDDFTSPRHLAEYLKVLDRDSALYNSYFRYRTIIIINSWKATPQISLWTLRWTVPPSKLFLSFYLLEYDYELLKLNQVMVEEEPECIGI